MECESPASSGQECDDFQRSTTDVRPQFSRWRRKFLWVAIPLCGLCFVLLLLAVWHSHVTKPPYRAPSIHYVVPVNLALILAMNVLAWRCPACRKSILTKPRRYCGDCGVHVPDDPNMLSPFWYVLRYWKSPPDRFCPSCKKDISLGPDHFCANCGAHARGL